MRVPSIALACEQLGFDFSDIRIVIGSHEHGDHMEGDALVKELNGAEVVAMAEQVPGLDSDDSGQRAGHEPAVD